MQREPTALINAIVEHVLHALSQITLPCGTGCTEIEELVFSATNVTSLTLEVREMCQPDDYTAATLEKIEVYGDYINSGNRSQIRYPELDAIGCIILIYMSRPNQSA